MWLAASQPTEADLVKQINDLMKKSPSKHEIVVRYVEVSSSTMQSFRHQINIILRDLYCFSCH
jgi:ribosomal protein L10